MYYRTVNTCGRCHPGEGSGNETLFANNLITYNDFKSRYKITGDTSDISKFKVPSLINIMYTAPYMHDGRFNSINEVIEHYDEHLVDISKKNPNKFEHVDLKNLKLIDYDKEHFNLFFNAFTDSTILTDKKFSNPFNSKNFKWKDFPNFK
jgi:cytochrome c peroxidase